MFRWILIPACLVLPLTGWSWGFYAHKKINRIAVFLLPPEMLVLYKKHLVFQYQMHFFITQNVHGKK